MRQLHKKLWPRSLCCLCVLCASALSGFALDREAFSIPHYDLNVQIDPSQHRLAVRGKLTLRNDTATPQKIAVLQISSSLAWRSIKAGDKAVQYLAQPYASDIDHTGGLSEAIVTLPQDVAPHNTIDLDIAYEGLVLLDATRLTRIGAPDEEATESDWDQIEEECTAVRGAGHVAWYPIATEVVNLSEGNSLFEVLGRWKAREVQSVLSVRFEPSGVVVAGECVPSHDAHEGSSCTSTLAGNLTPSFALANYKLTRRPHIEIYALPLHASAAEIYADEAEKVVPLITDWFGKPQAPAKTAEVPEPESAPFESGSLLFAPLSNAAAKSSGLAAVHQLTHAAIESFRPWINEGLAHFAQALYLEQQNGRKAALDYMGLHRSRLASLEQPENDPSHSLINTTSEELYRSKAMSVWWMLRDMLGDAALKKALAAYQPEQDKEPSYMPRLIAAQSQRDLEWFFDDWVYRDRGLPDFKVDGAFARQAMNKSFLVTVTIDNLGSAGAEVPFTIKFAGGEITKRLEVRAKSKATIRVETPATPQQITVNDGSIPESDTTNNTFKIEAPQP